MEEKEVEKKKDAGYNLEPAEEFAKELAKMYNLELDTVKIDRKIPYNAPQLSKFNRKIAWVLPRTSKTKLFTIYLFHEGEKDIIDIPINDDEAIDNAIEKIGKVASSITEREEKPKKKSKKKPKKESKKPRNYESIEWQISKLKPGTKMVIPAGFDEKNGELIKVVKNAGAKIENELIVKIA